MIKFTWATSGNKPKINRNLTERLRILIKETKEKEKGTRWMPRISPATKDATSCENPCGGANGRYDAGVSEWDNPIRRKSANPLN